MSKIRERLPISLANALVIGALLLGAAAAGVRANLVGALILVAVAIGVAGMSFYARRVGADDRTRIGNLEPRDERDRAVNRRAFALVGATALVVTGGELLVRVVMGDYDGAALMRFLVLSTAWSIGVANSLEKS